MPDATSTPGAEGHVPQRGGLAVTITPSTNMISAASEFSVAVTITNPFDVPVKIRSVATRLPIDLLDASIVGEEDRQSEAIPPAVAQALQVGMGSAVDQQSRQALLEYAYRFLYRRQDKGLAVAQPAGGKPTMGNFLAVLPKSDAVAASLNQQGRAPAAEVAGAAAAPSVPPAANGQAEAGGDSGPRRVVPEADPEALLYAQELQRANGHKLDLSALESLGTLQPSDATTFLFTLRTRQTLFFRPADYNLNYIVAYQADRREHTQTVHAVLHIDASLWSIVLGALVGAFFGVIASMPDYSKWVQSPTLMLAKLISALVLSGFGMIAFARKEGAQPVLSVQDFWGGLFVGFLVGYSGSQVLGNVFLSGANAAPAK